MLLIQTDGARVPYPLCRDIPIEMVSLTKYLHINILCNRTEKDRFLCHENFLGHTQPPSADPSPSSAYTVHLFLPISSFAFNAIELKKILYFVRWNGKSGILVEVMFAPQPYSNNLMITQWATTSICSVLYICMGPEYDMHCELYCWTTILCCVCLYWHISFYVRLIFCLSLAIYGVGVW